MKQMSFADAEFAGKRKQTRRERFLIEMDQVVLWKGLIALRDGCDLMDVIGRRLRAQVAE